MEKLWLCWTKQLTGGLFDNSETVETIHKNGAEKYISIPIDKISKAGTIVANTSNNRETLASMYNRLKPDFIINGGFFWNDNQWKSHSINLLISEGKQNNAGNPNFSRFGFTVHNDKEIGFNHYKWSSTLTAMIGGSPALIKNGKIDIDHRVDGDSSRHPRSAIGMTEDKLILYVYDGRTANFKGLTIKELADKMKELGCVDAIALDGGGSSRLMARGKVVNNPTENRPVHNAIGIWL